ncbi:LacI family DNA-binding transcriptional regulator [Agromyces atrinae]|uniref:LacI family DNA-binding transcriptional regulator n=1 Tax=Agromyces atrinae TaxID=592376 RepID=UPI001F5890ED|nr:LacI family DNA-binding transcriptional regulator [Agromyces atrinae]MCI2956929.1 LacI family DNA-binding transcriptional regulator [Agromyces atrinae]
MTGAPHARPTLADVAAHAGVSASTASIAFSGSGPVSDATKEKVRAAAEELGYAGPDPRARSLRRGRSGIVGVVLEERVRAAFLDPVKIQMLDGLSEGIAPLGAGLLLLTDAGSGAGTAVSVDDAPVDAVVLIGCSPRFDEALDTFRRRGIPVVAIEGFAPAGVVAHIGIDNRDASRRGAEHLRELGHEHVAVVSLPFESTRARGILTPEIEARASVDTSIERLAGARDVFPDVVVSVAGGSLIEEGQDAARLLLAAENPPTAIIAQSDLLAAGVIRAAEELGIAVPGDLSVLGFDGIRVDGLPYDLTTLVQPSVAKGRAAGEAVVAMLAGEQPASVGFTSTLHVGATTAPPRTS